MLALTHLRRTNPLLDWSQFGPLTWWLTRAANQVLPLQRINEITLVTLRRDLPACKQRKLVARLTRQLPLSQRHLILDVAEIADDDAGLPSLIEAIVRESSHCHLDLALAGVSAAKMAYLELTRMSHLMPCYERSGDAVRSLMHRERPQRFRIA